MHRKAGGELRSRAKRVGRHVTIREVAKAAGASVSTISAALNNSDYVSAEMRSRVDGAIKDLGYRPNDLARGLRLQKTHSIAIVVPDLSNNFYIEVVRGAKDWVFCREPIPLRSLCPTYRTISISKWCEEPRTGFSAENPFHCDRCARPIEQFLYRSGARSQGLGFLQRTHSIAIVVPDLSNNFYIEVVRGAKDWVFC